MVVFIKWSLFVPSRLIAFRWRSVRDKQKVNSHQFSCIKFKSDRKCKKNLSWLAAYYETTWALLPHCLVCLIILCSRIVLFPEQFFLKLFQQQSQGEKLKWAMKTFRKPSMGRHCFSPRFLPKDLLAEEHLKWIKMN